MLRMIRGLDRRGGVVHWRVLRAAGLRESVELGLDSDGGRGSKRTDRSIAFFSSRSLRWRGLQSDCSTLTREISRATARRDGSAVMEVRGG